MHGINMINSKINKIVKIHSKVVILFSFLRFAYFYIFQ